MGLSLHYRGQIADIQHIKTICKELTDIASKMNWKRVSLDEDWTKPADANVTVTEQGAQIRGHLPLKGVSLTVDPKSDSVSFFFDPEGNLCDPLNLIMITEGHLGTGRRMGFRENAVFFSGNTYTNYCTVEIS